MDNIVVRRARLGDEECMAAYMSALSAEAPDTVTRRDPPTANDQLRFLERAEQVERAFILLAFDGAEVVGLLDLWAGSKPETRHSAGFGMSVKAERRGQGIGRHLLKTAIDHALLWDGFCRLELEVVAWNAPAIHLYEELGFKHEGRKLKAMNIRGGLRPRK